MKWRQQFAVHLERVRFCEPPCAASGYDTSPALFSGFRLPNSRRGGRLDSVEVTGATVRGVHYTVAGGGPTQPYLLVHIDPLGGNDDSTSEFTWTINDGQRSEMNDGFPLLLTSAPFAAVTFDGGDRPFYHVPSRSGTTINTLSFRVTGPNGSIPYFTSITLTLTITYDSELRSEASSAAAVGVERGEQGTLSRVQRYARSRGTFF